MFKQRQSVDQSDDVTLVMCALGGDREAFCTIVSRYQNLLCSLAYASLGDVKYSEDIAQEAFVEAWKKLDSLREPEKLKSWLCGILRFKVSRHLRNEGKQPTRSPSDLDAQADISDPDQQLEEAAIKGQQQALLWQTLQSMEQTYREPLILFYRENQSVEQVAKELDLTADTTKQRLSRGRKLLQKTMEVFVEEALAATKPGAAFTAGVLTVINSIAPPAKAAAVGAGAAKTGSLFSVAAIITVLASLSGVISAFFGLRAGLDQSRTASERRFTFKLVGTFILVAVLYVAGVFACRVFALHYPEQAITFTILSQVVVVGFVMCYVSFTVYMFSAQRQLRAQERIFHPEAFHRKSDQPGSSRREYKSRWTLMGVPLVHFRFGMPEQGDVPVFGWIAGGDRAYGMLFAWGGVAIAPVSVGIVSLGVVTIGAVGFGIISTGTVAFGLIGFGASAIAYKAYASLSAVGWEGAFSNGFSMAKEGAMGPIAFAKEVNNESAAALVQMDVLAQNYLWVLLFITLLVIVPAAAYASVVRKRMKH